MHWIYDAVQHVCHELSYLQAKGCCTLCCALFRNPPQVSRNISHRIPNRGPVPALKQRSWTAPRKHRSFRSLRSLRSLFVSVQKISRASLDCVRMKRQHIG